MLRFMKPKVIWVRPAVGRRDNLDVGRDRRDRRLLMDAGSALLNQRRRGCWGAGGHRWPPLFGRSENRPMVTDEIGKC